jgi:hypothetical protein
MVARSQISRLQVPSPVRSSRFFGQFRSLGLWPMKLSKAYQVGLGVFFYISNDCADELRRQVLTLFGRRTPVQI